MQNLKSEYQKQSLDSTVEEQHNLSALLDRINSSLQTQWRSSVLNYEHLEEKERENNEYIRQMELDIDDDIERMKISYENECNMLNENAKHLTMSVREPCLHKMTGGEEFKCVARRSVVYASGTTP